MLARTVSLALAVAAALACAALARAGFSSGVEAGSLSVSSATLAAPRGIEASSEDCERGAPTVDVSWEGASAVATGYAILRSSAYGGPFVEVGSVSGSDAGDFTDAAGLAPSTRYWYAVEATVGRWTSPASAAVAVDTPACD